MFPAILGLALRRQAALWKGWRPWCAAFGLALPGSFMLMGTSLSVFLACERAGPPGAGTAAPLAILAGQLSLLVVWSWTGGFLVGSLSRRTLWASLAAVGGPCLFCLERFRVPSVPWFSLFLFLGPAAWGLRRAMRPAPLRRSFALGLAVLVTLLMAAVSSARGRVHGTAHDWFWNSILSLPAWFLLATAWAHNRRVGAGEVG